MQCMLVPVTPSILLVSPSTYCVSLHLLHPVYYQYHLILIVYSVSQHLLHPVYYQYYQVFIVLSMLAPVTPSILLVSASKYSIRQHLLHSVYFQQHQITRTTKDIQCTVYVSFLLHSVQYQYHQVCILYRQLVAVTLSILPVSPGGYCMQCRIASLYPDSISIYYYVQYLV